ncbi:hypothetical protein [Kaistia sp. MMO-174]|uniref:hypothetical protein n=1 Tax=Kaistia sp. MMO-174 TaxID=3081256 RepID=UPI0030167744
MTITYPIDLLADWPGWATLDLSYGDETSGQAGGQIRVKSRRAPLWTMQATTRDLEPNELRRWKARLAALENGQKTFWGYDSASFYPAAYPHGSWPTGGAFNGEAAAISALPSTIALRLKALPASFKITTGDHIAFSYGSGPLYALHQVMEDVVADGLGVTPAFEVRPPIRQGAAINNVVKVKRPACLMMIVPGSVSTPANLNARGPISFNAIQVIG